MRKILRELPETLSLALPIMLGMLGHMLIQLTDCWMLGHYGTLELAASAFGSRIVLLILYVGIGFGQAVSALSSQALGAGDTPRARGIYTLSQYSAFIFSALSMVAAVAILPAYDRLGQPEMVAAYAKPFSLMIAASFIPTLIFQTLRNYYEALKRPWVPFAFLFATVLVNILFNWIFIFGKLGFPAMGIIGSGLGTILARTVVMVAFVWFAHRQGEALHGRNTSPLPMDALPKILKIAVTAGLGMVVTTLAYVVGSFWIGRDGAAFISANQIVGLLDATVYMIPLGISFALTVRLGRAKGAGEFSRLSPIFRGGALTTILFAGAVSVATVAWRQPIAEAFSLDPLVVSAILPMLVISGLFRIFDQLSVLCIGGLRGLDDVVAPVIIYLCSHWLVAMPLGYLFCFPMGGGALGVWAGYFCGILFAGTALVIRSQYTISRFGTVDKPVAADAPTTLPTV